MQNFLFCNSKTKNKISKHCTKIVPGTSVRFLGRLEDKEVRACFQLKIILIKTIKNKLHYI